MHPRLGHMVLRARGLGLARLACEIAAVLSERDPVRGGPGTPDPDLRTRLDALHGRALPHGVTADRGATAPHRTRRAADRATTRSIIAIAPRRWLQRSRTRRLSDLLLAFAYPDRIGRARAETGGRYALSGGRGAVLPGPAALARSEYIVVAALDAGEREARIQLAAPLDPQQLEEHFADRIEESTLVEWDPRSETVAARRLRRLGQLVLREEPLHRLGPAAIPALLVGVRSLGLRCLPWTRDLEQWRARVAFARANDPLGSERWPDVDDAALLDTAESWLAPWLEGITRRDQLARIDLRAALHAMLDWNAQQRLDRLAPTHLGVPSGSRIAIDYSSGVPTLAVRLQEVFGLTASPRIAEGRVPVTLELLSPARRPVQVTRDLESFWSRGYHEVRKELKGRYPKHYWPDDPREATATRRVRPPGT